LTCIHAAFALFYCLVQFEFDFPEFEFACLLFKNAKPFFPSLPLSAQPSFPLLPLPFLSTLYSPAQIFLSPFLFFFLPARPKPRRRPSFSPLLPLSPPGGDHLSVASPTSCSARTRSESDRRLHVPPRAILGPHAEARSRRINSIARPPLLTPFELQPPPLVKP